MRLIEQMRAEVAAARDAGRSPDHWEITPEALERLRSEAAGGELSGSDYAGLWALDGIALRESMVPRDKDVLLITRQQ